MLLEIIKRWFAPATYSTELESYINRHHPQHEGDIERLTHQYNRSISQGRTL